MFRVTQFEPRTLSWWYSQRKKIDINPSYQRSGGIWSDKDKAFLIDSIINDFDIPKLYIADFLFANAKAKLNEKKLPYAIIDGKQRLEAVFDFLEGKVSLNEDVQYDDDPSLRLGGLRYQDLANEHPEIAEKINNYHLTVVRVTADDEDKINEMFVRLNRSKPLTGAEIRNAMVGEVPKVIRAMTQHTFFSSCVGFKTLRGEDKNTAAKFLLFEFNDRLTDTKRSQLDALVEEWEAADKKLRERAKDRAYATLVKLAEVFSEEDPLLASAGNVPVYYWFVRNAETGALGQVRPFLVAFSQELKANRTETKEKGKAIDKELAAFQDASRSTNDQGSYETRVEILERRFKIFCRTQSKSKRTAKKRKISRPA